MKRFMPYCPPVALMIGALMIGSLLLAGCAPAPVTRVISATAPATPPGVSVAAVYMEIVSATDDVLIDIVTPLAERTEIHETIHNGDMMQMRPVTRLTLQAGKPVRFASGGMHLMLMNLRKPLLVEQSFPIDLHFQNAGTITAQVQVVPPGTLTGSH